MTIPLGPFHLSVTFSLGKYVYKFWEERAAAGMDDAELAHLNVRNTRVPEEVIWGQRQHLLVDLLR